RTGKQKRNRLPMEQLFHVNRGNQCSSMRLPSLKTKKARIIIAVILLLVIFRILLPYIVLHYANKSLAKVDGYYGHLDDIDISLYRGAYKIKDMYLNKRDSATGKQTDFFKVALIDLSVEWKALLHGELVGELVVDRPVLAFTK